VHQVLPKGAPLIAWSHQLTVSLENGTSFHYDPFTAVPEWVMQDQRHACEECLMHSWWPAAAADDDARRRPPVPPACADYACVSYVDEHVGAILGSLDRSGLAPETAVIFHADHVRAAAAACVP
jgi:arylsulfatase A-like enzyme